MRKLERVYRQLLKELLEDKKRFFYQKELAEKCMISIGLVNYSLKPLEKIGAVEKRGRGFTISDPRKLLMHWATVRDLQGDVLGELKGEQDAELKMPPGAILTAYSAAKIHYEIEAADYGEVWVYSGIEELKEKFSNGPVRIIVLRSDEHLKAMGRAPLAQVFVDLWNIPTWYAREFMLAVRDKIDGILAELGY